MLVVPPDRDRRNPAGSHRSSDSEWNGMPARRAIVFLLGAVAFVAGIAAFGFWAGALAALCVPILSGIQLGVARALREMREMREMREKNERSRS
jgi:hypothetical protein